MPRLFSGFLADCLSDSRKGHIKGKIVVVYDQNKQIVIGWCGIFHYSTMELMVYVKTKYRRRGYGTAIVKKLLSKLLNHAHIMAFIPEYDINNDFYLNNINDRRIIV